MPYGSGTGTATKKRTDEQTMQAMNNRDQQRRRLGGGRGGARGGGAGGTGRGGGRTGREPGAVTGAGSTPPVPDAATYASGANQLVSPVGGWGSQLNPYGGKQAANDPWAFWSMYGGKNKGWDPGGGAQAFYTNTYDTERLAAAAFPGAGQYTSDPQKFAGQTAMANALSGGTFMNIDAGQLVGNVLNTLATSNVQALSKVNPMLAEIINANRDNPGAQAVALTNFLTSMLQGVLPDEAVSNLGAMLEIATREFFQKAGSAGNQNLDIQTFAKYLTQQFGPTMGM
jgi:hypothetical protein